MATFTVSRGAPASAPPSPSSVVDEHALDAVIGTVSGNKERWARTSVPERIALLDRIVDDTMTAAEAWVDDAARAKGIPAATSAVGEEWHSGPALVARMARLLRKSLADIQAHGSPRLPGELKSGPDGRVVAPVFPGGMYDRMLFPSTSAEVW